MPASGLRLVRVRVSGSADDKVWAKVRYCSASAKISSAWARISKMDGGSLHIEGG